MLSIALAACRYEALPPLSGDAHGADSPTTDAPMTNDASGDASTDAARACYTAADLSSLTLGQSTSPAVMDWFYTPTSGPNSGKKTFRLAGKLNNDTLSDAITIEVVRPTAGFAVNQAYPFTTDPDPNHAYSAASSLLGDIDTTNGVYLQYLSATNGSITFTAIGEVSNSNITGSVTMVDYLEVNETTNTFVTGGCATKLGGMMFYLRQM
ncbi:MAG TPA: hypothetical protein VIV40_22495 [Kofleriaceae bacterium]